MNMRKYGSVVLQRGFSLVELMVALVIGLVTTLVLMQVGISFEDQRKTTIGSGDSVDASSVAVHTLKSAIQQGGLGLNAPAVIGCNLAAFRRIDASVLNMAMAPVNIVQGGNDVLTVLTADVRRYADSRLRVDHPGDATPFQLERIFGFNVGDVFLVAHENGVPACSLGEVTGVVQTPLRQDGQVLHQGAGSRFNRDGGNGVVYTSRLQEPGTNTVMYNLGPQPAFVQFRVLDGRLQRIDMLANPDTPVDILGDVVSFQAEYGFRDMADQLAWSVAVPDIDGIGGAGSDGDWDRLVAVRFAVVVRHSKLEKPNASNQCVTTERVDYSFGTLDIPEGDGRCYRYRAIEAVVPIRNMMWGQQ